MVGRLELGDTEVPDVVSIRSCIEKLLIHMLTESFNDEVNAFDTRPDGVAVVIMSCAAFLPYVLDLRRGLHVRADERLGHKVRKSYDIARSHSSIGWPKRDSAENFCGGS